MFFRVFCEVVLERFAGFARKTFPDRFVEAFVDKFVEIHEKKSGTVVFAQVVERDSDGVGKFRKVVEVVIDIGSYDFFDSHCGCFKPKGNLIKFLKIEETELDGVIEFVCRSNAKSLVPFGGVGVAVS